MKKKILNKPRWDALKQVDHPHTKHIIQFLLNSLQNNREQINFQAKHIIQFLLNSLQNISYGLYILYKPTALLLFERLKGFRLMLLYQNDRC